MFAHVLRELPRREHVGDRRDHDELVAAEADQLVVTTGALAQCFRARDDHRVAGLVTELVVHRFEAVEVEQQERDPLAVALRRD